MGSLRIILTIAFFAASVILIIITTAQEVSLVDYLVLLQVHQIRILIGARISPTLKKARLLSGLGFLSQSSLH